MGNELLIRQLKVQISLDKLMLQRVQFRLADPKVLLKSTPEFIADVKVRIARNQTKLILLGVHDVTE